MAESAAPSPHPIPFPLPLQGAAPAAACEAVPVKAFPTWVFPGGRIVEGEMSFEDIEAELDAAEVLAAAEGSGGGGGGAVEAVGL